MNAKDEFLHHISVMKKTTKCAQLSFETSYDKFDDFFLPVGYSEAEMQVFLQKIDRDYDNGFGGQELYGTIWYEDGTWSERGEYDGSEWWEYQSCPDIPEILGYNSSRMLWIVVNIGCIECGVSSNIVGVFDTHERAEAVARSCDEKYDWREGGQNHFEVFPLPETNKINEEYEI